MQEELSEFGMLWGMSVNISIGKLAIKNGN